MTPTVIACLGDKGGVGKSTMARFIAAYLAAQGRSVILSDFHRSQQTSLQWYSRRENAGIQPVVPTELGVRAKDLLHRPCDVVVVDGAGNGASTSRSVAMIADRIIIPTSVSREDLLPQRDFARELLHSGVACECLLFVINFRQTDIDLLDEARFFLSSVGKVAATSLPISGKVQRENDAGRALGEIHDLAHYAEHLMQEVTRG